MDKETKSGYIAGILFLLIFFAFLSSIINIGLDKLDLLSSILTATFGILGFGSLWKPKAIGAVATALIEMFTKNTEKSSSDSHNKQLQKKTSGSVQVMATHGAKVNVSVASEKKENIEKTAEEIMLNEKRIINTKKRHVHNLGDLDEGDQLIGEASSTRPIDIEFLSVADYRRLRDGEPYKCQNRYRHILATNINFTVPMDGTWYLVIRNKGMSYAKVAIRLEYISAKSMPSP